MMMPQDSISQSSHVWKVRIFFSDVVSLTPLCGLWGFDRNFQGEANIQNVSGFEYQTVGPSEGTEMGWNTERGETWSSKCYPYLQAMERPFGRGTPVRGVTSHGNQSTSY